MCESKGCATSSHSGMSGSGKLVETLLDDKLKSLGVDTVFITGSLSIYKKLPLKNAIDAKKLGYNTFVIKDTLTYYYEDDLQNIQDEGISLIDSTTLLQDRYHCQDNWLECPLSGDCVPKEKQCDSFYDCTDGFDEDPTKVVSDCCDEFILTGMDKLSGLWYHQYMGVYEKISCSRLVRGVYCVH